MGQIDNRLQGENAANPQSAEEVARILSQTVHQLQHTLSTQLNQDVERLQRKKRQLMDDIEALEGDYSDLQHQHRQLQTDHAAELSQQQLAQQQLWAKRLAQALATHLQSRLSDGLIAPASPPPGLADSLTAANQQVSALDMALHRTLQTLQQDLNTYQSSLSQQVSRMHSMEHQGEAILEALVSRLSQNLQYQMTQPTATTLGPSAASSYSGVQLPSPSPVPPDLPPAAPDPVAVAPPPSASPAPTPAPAPAPSKSRFQQGLLLVILSTLALSVHNVVVGIIGYGGNLFGQVTVPGIFPLNIPNSLMLLWLRMVVVLPLMALVARQLYPPVWKDLRALARNRDRRPLFQVVASGCFLFLSQVLIYKAISDIGPGVAVTLLFMYPLITVPLAWFLFGDRPSSLRLVVMAAISMGIVFTALPRITTDLGNDVAGGGVSLWGVGAALLSSVAFALFLVAMELCFRRLHPVPVSLMQFATIFVLTSLILFVGSFVGLAPSTPTNSLGLMVGALLLGVFTLLGYLFNNYGVQMMGAAQASIIAASGPVVTAILALIVTPGDKSSLAFIQWMGVLLVTLGVTSLSLERLALKKTATKKSA